MAQVGLQLPGIKIDSVPSFNRPNSHLPASPHSHRPMRITMSSTTGKTYWASINNEIETHLKQAIPIRDPIAVFKPMHDLVFAQPRSMAPALCVAACELLGGHQAQALPAASALQVMLAAVYTHDHLPLTDRPNTQSGPVHHAFGPNIELLTGDGLLSFGYELLVRFNGGSLGEYHSDRVLQTVVEVSRAMGSQGMVDERFREVERGQCDVVEAYEEGWLRHVYEKKDGGLHACAAACGAILGGGSEEEIEKLRKYGHYVGMIQGVLHGIGREEKDVVLDMVQKLRVLALKQLEGLNATRVEAISNFIDVCNA